MFKMNQADISYRAGIKRVRTGLRSTKHFRYVHIPFDEGILDEV
jgi:hypothetical protein